MLKPTEIQFLDILLIHHLLSVAALIPNLFPFKQKFHHFQHKHDVIIVGLLI